MPDSDKKFDIDMTTAMINTGTDDDAKLLKECSEVAGRCGIAIKKIADTGDITKLQAIEAALNRALNPQPTPAPAAEPNPRNRQTQPPAQPAAATATPTTASAAAVTAPSKGGVIGLAKRAWAGSKTNK